jgi:hypothetical protein
MWLNYLIAIRRIKSQSLAKAELSFLIFDLKILKVSLKFLSMIVMTNFMKVPFTNHYNGNVVAAWYEIRKSEFEKFSIFSHESESKKI